MNLHIIQFSPVSYVVQHQNFITLQQSMVYSMCTTRKNILHAINNANNILKDLMYKTTNEGQCYILLELHIFFLSI
jgi:hypothetical protein